MLNLKLQSFLSITRLTFVLLMLSFFGHSQNQRMERLALQYRVMQSASEKEKNELNLAVADKFINEGDYQSAVDLNEKVKENESNRDLKYFLAGKAEFLADNYEGSLTFLNLVNADKLEKRKYHELGFYKLLDFNHLLQPDSSYNELTRLLLRAKMDTTGIFAEAYSLRPPKLLNLKKARRRSALFPGAGLCYVGEGKRAIGSAFMCFAALGYAAYSIYTQYYFTAVLTGGGEFLRFYKGGKRASVKLGSKKNRLAYLNYVIPKDNYAEKKLSELLK